MFLFKTQAYEKKKLFKGRGHDTDTDFYICDFGAEIFVIDAKIVTTLTGV